MSPLEIALLICLAGAGVAIVIYENDARDQRKLITQLNRLNVALARTVDSQAVILDSSIRQTTALRGELAAYLPSPAEDGALTFDAVATEAIEVTRERAEVEAETGSKVWS